MNNSKVQTDIIMNKYEHIVLTPEEVDEMNVKRKAGVQEKMLMIKGIVKTGKQLDKEELNNILFGAYTNTYNRFHFFLQVKSLLSGSEYWSNLSDVYTMSDNLYSLRKEVRECFASKEPNREALMSIEEKQYLENLPNKVTIYRGMTVKENISGKFGISWSLEENTAKYFIEDYDYSDTEARQRQLDDG